MEYAGVLSTTYVTNLYCIVQHKTVRGKTKGLGESGLLRPAASPMQHGVGYVGKGVRCTLSHTGHADVGGEMARIHLARTLRYKAYIRSGEVKATVGDHTQPEYLALT